MNNEEIEKEIAYQVNMEADNYIRNKKPKNAELCRYDFEYGATIFANKYREEILSHERTKLELESTRQLCRTYSEAIAATNFSIKTGITPPEQF